MFCLGVGAPGSRVPACPGNPKPYDRRYIYTCIYIYIEIYFVHLPGVWSKTNLSIYYYSGPRADGPRRVIIVSIRYGGPAVSVGRTSRARVLRTRRLPGESLKIREKL